MNRRVRGPGQVSRVEKHRVVTVLWTWTTYSQTEDDLVYKEKVYILGYFTTDTPVSLTLICIDNLIFS